MVSGAIAELSPIASKFATTEEAAAYARWFRARVQASIDDPCPSVPHDEVMARLQTKIDETKQRFGFMVGRIKVPADFNTMSAAEIQALFEA